jgi:hypothetical protein
MNEEADMFTVMVDDNFHYMDEDERRALGEFATWEEAVQAARQIVERSLSEHYKPGMTAEQLYSAYTGFGEDPFIVPKPEGQAFSAWTYAKQRCAQICASG